MSYAEQIRHPDGALNPPREKQSGLNWWEFVAVHWLWFLVGGIVALIVIGRIRPQWLAKIGIHIGGIVNPYGWV